MSATSSDSFATISDGRPPTPTPEPQYAPGPWKEWERWQHHQLEIDFCIQVNFPIKSWASAAKYIEVKDETMLEYLADYPICDWIVNKKTATAAYKALLDRYRLRQKGLAIFTNGVPNWWPADLKDVEPDPRPAPRPTYRYAPKPVSLPELPSLSMVDIQRILGYGPRIGPQAVGRPGPPPQYRMTNGGPPPVHPIPFYSAHNSPYAPVPQPHPPPVQRPTMHPPPAHPPPRPDAPIRSAVPSQQPRPVTDTNLTLFTTPVTAEEKMRRDDAQRQAERMAIEQQTKPAAKISRYTVARNVTPPPYKPRDRPSLVMDPTSNVQIDRRGVFCGDRDQHEFPWQAAYSAGHPTKWDDSIYPKSRLVAMDAVRERNAPKLAAYVKANKDKDESRRKDKMEKAGKVPKGTKVDHSEIVQEQISKPSPDLTPTEPVAQVVELPTQVAESTGENAEPVTKATEHAGQVVETAAQVTELGKKRAKTQPRRRPYQKGHANSSDAYHTGHLKFASDADEVKCSSLGFMTISAALRAAMEDPFDKALAGIEVLVDPGDRMLIADLEIAAMSIMDIARTRLQLEHQKILSDQAALRIIDFCPDVLFDYTLLKVVCETSLGNMIIQQRLGLNGAAVSTSTVTKRITAGVERKREGKGYDKHNTMDKDWRIASRKEYNQYRAFHLARRAIDESVQHQEDSDFDLQTAPAQHMASKVAQAYRMARDRSASVESELTDMSSCPPSPARPTSAGSGLPASSMGDTKVNGVNGTSESVHVAAPHTAGLTTQESADSDMKDTIVIGQKRRRSSSPIVEHPFQADPSDTGKGPSGLRSPHAKRRNLGNPSQAVHD